MWVAASVTAVLVQQWCWPGVRVVLLVLWLAYPVLQVCPLPDLPHSWGASPTHLGQQLALDQLLPGVAPQPINQQSTAWPRLLYAIATYHSLDQATAWLTRVDRHHPTAGWIDAAIAGNDPTPQRVTPLGPSHATTTRCWGMVAARPGLIMPTNQPAAG